MRRRTGNIEAGKPPRKQAMKKSKFADTFFGSSIVYMKFFGAWACILFLDFIVEFRFEYLWPFYLLMQSCIETWKCQGVVYSVFFVFVAVTSDAICFFFIPIQWIFFMASTYVWIQYVWHTDRGICVPTVLLWTIFMYVETVLRLKNLRNHSLHVKLCLPFAAHCVGHPFVSLGLGFKSYIQYKIRIKTQKHVEIENNFYYELLKGALPQPEPQQLAIQSTDQQLQCLPAPIPVTSQKKSSDKKSKHTTSQEQGDVRDIQVTVRNRASSKNKQKETKKIRNTNNNHHDGNGDNQNCKSDKKNKTVIRSSSQSSQNPSPKTNNNRKSPKLVKKNILPSNEIITKTTCIVTNTCTAAVTSLVNSTKKIELTIEQKLEQTINKLRSELQEVKRESKHKIDAITIIERNTKNELKKLKEEHETLNNKYQCLCSGKQRDKLSIMSMERKIKVEIENRNSTEKYLQEEIRRLKERDENKKKENNEILNKEKEECIQLRKSKIELENKIRKFSESLSKKEEGFALLKKEISQLQQRERNAKESETLMSALEAMKEKNLMLENSLSAETKIKLDLFSALGDAKRQLEISHRMILKREQEANELKNRISEMISIMHTNQTNYQQNFHGNQQSRPPFYSNQLEYQHSNTPTSNYHGNNN